MGKMLKNISIQAMSIIIAMAMLVSIFAPLLVYAVTFEDGNKLTMSGKPTINDTIFEYEHGKVTVSKNGTLQNIDSIDLSKDDEIKIKLIPDEGYQARLHNDVDNYDLIANGEKIKVNFGFTRDRYDLMPANNGAQAAS